MERTTHTNERLDALIAPYISAVRAYRPKVEDFYGLGVLLLPLVFSGRGDLRQSKDFAFFIYTALSLLLFGFNTKALPNTLKIPLAGLVGLSFFSTASFRYYDPIYQLAMFPTGCLLFAQAYTHLSCANIARLTNWVSASAILYSLWMLGNHWGFDLYDWMTVRMVREGGKMVPIEDTSLVYRVVGALGNNGVSAGHVAILGASLIRRRWWPFLVLPFCAIFSTDSQSPALGLIVALITFCFNEVLRGGGPNLLSYRFLLVYLCSILGAMHLFSAQVVQESGMRLTEWVTALEAVGFSLTGYGLGWVPLIYSRVYSGKVETFFQLHNEFLELYVALGLVGVLLVGWILRVCLRNPLGGIRVYDTYLYMVVAGMVYGFFWFPLHIGPIAVVLLISFAVLAKRSTIWK